jgi:hypothetical protein
MTNPTLTALWDHELDLQSRLEQLEHAVGVLALCVVGLSITALVYVWKGLPDA